MILLASASSSPDGWWAYVVVGVAVMVGWATWTGFGTIAVATAAALAMFVSDLASVSPTWSALDVDEVDWVAVLTTVQDRFSSDMLGGLPSPGRDDNTEDPR